MFGSWTLALAAYNCGEGLLSRAVCRGDSSFLELDLPSETERFVPRFAAALEAYRQVPDDGANLSIIWVPPATDLRVLAAGCSIHPDSIVSLNRAYLHERTPSYGDGWDLVVPQPIARQAFTEAWQMDGSVYTVREGDTWGSIASSLNVTESSLVAANPGILIEPGARLALPEPDEIPVNASTGDAEGWFYYTVRSGDTLSGIGASVGVGSSEVATWNDISRSSTIYPGQRLVLRGSPAGGTGTPAPSPSPSPGGGSVTHTVVSGDTLWDLAGRYGVTVEQIQQLNSLEGSSLRIGQILVISAE
jgi:membrane-bound lytic murein transglycosylase D